MKWLLKYTEYENYVVLMGLREEIGETRSIPEGLVGEVFAYMIDGILSGNPQGFSISRADVEFFKGLGILPTDFTINLANVGINIDITEEEFFRFTHEYMMKIMMKDYISQRKKQESSKEEEEADGGEDESDDHIVSHIIQRAADEGWTVLGDRDGNIGGESLLERFDPRYDPVGNFDRIGIGPFLDDQAEGLLILEPGQFPDLLDRVIDTPQFGDSDLLPVRGRDI